MSRIKARENLMQLVFSYEFDKEEDFCVENFFEEDFIKENNLTDEDKSYILENFNGIKQNYEEIKNLIKTNLVGYSIERICKTDLAILIVSIYQIKFLNENKKVIISSAVDMSKKYSPDNSYKFVNGLLAKVTDAI